MINICVSYAVRTTSKYDVFFNISRSRKVFKKVISKSLYRIVQPVLTDK